MDRRPALPAAAPAGPRSPPRHRPERLGLAEASGGTSHVGRRRKHYAITAAGREALVERQAQWDVVAHALQQVWRSAQDGLQSPPRVAEGWA